MNAVPCRGQRIILNRTQLCLSDVKISKDRVFISVVFLKKLFPIQVKCPKVAKQGQSWRFKRSTRRRSFSFSKHLLIQH